MAHDKNLILKCKVSWTETGYLESKIITIKHENTIDYKTNEKFHPTEKRDYLADYKDKIIKAAGVPIQYYKDNVEVILMQTFSSN